MKSLTAKNLRKLWSEFFSSKNHAIISSASLIPENDPTVLFTTAGMHPLVPYLMGQKHPSGKRLANIQKCVRTGDIDEVGDDSHCTFFEMLGSWSLGDYFKENAIKFSHEFLTNKKYLGIDPSMLAVSVFEGDKDSPRDEESAKYWIECGLKKEQIYYLPKKNNWWGPPGLTGPCGPDTEMFIVRGENCSNECSPACECGNFLEIWNDVFMQYNKTGEGKFEPLSQKNVDTGMGLERTLCIIQGVSSVYETDVFVPIMKAVTSFIGENSLDEVETKKAKRIISDHIRTAVFMIGDGVTPSNVDQGYILRRLIRRAIRFAKQLGIDFSNISAIAKTVLEVYHSDYSELKNETLIIGEIEKEVQKFEKTLIKGLSEFEKLCSYLVGDVISGKSAFKLYDTYGFPLEMTQELAKEKGLTVNEEAFKSAFADHQKLSQAGAEQKFKGGLADDGVAVTRLHTATHLLHKALKIVLNDDTVSQKGSNITSERLRFDFNFSRPMTENEIKKTEGLVNEQIKKKLSITKKEMTVDEAKKTGAIGLFKYDEKVLVYFIGGNPEAKDKNSEVFSIEFCGGPHVENTSELGTFKIQKEQSSSAGVRRIKAVLE